MTRVCAPIQFCPLYVESHWFRPGRSKHLGCVDDMIKPCKVERGKMDYDRAVARIEAIDPEMVAQCRFGREAWEQRQQRARNLRAMGAH